MITSSISAGIDVVALHQRPQRVGGELDGVHVLELPVPLPERGADGIDDHGILHGSSEGSRSRKTRPSGQGHTHGRIRVRFTVCFALVTAVAPAPSFLGRVRP